MASDRYRQPRLGPFPAYLHLSALCTRPLHLWCGRSYRCDGAVYAVPVWAAALIISSLYLLLIVVAILCRKPLFVHPFIRLLSKHVIGTQEELVLETLKAEHEVDLQKVKIETRVENATREINFYANLLSRLWKTLSGWLHK